MQSVIKRLRTAEDGKAFQGFTLSRYHSLLHEYIHDPRVVALGLFCDEKTCWIAIGSNRVYP